jgi:hypothetical protein
VQHAWSLPLGVKLLGLWFSVVWVPLVRCGVYGFHGVLNSIKN